MLTETETWIYLLLFVATFSVIWLLAWYWDRMWPDTTALLKKRGQPIKDEDIPK